MALTWSASKSMVYIMKIRRKSDIILWARIDLLLAQQQQVLLIQQLDELVYFFVQKRFHHLAPKTVIIRRIALATFEGNTRTTILSCKGSINCSPDEDIEHFY